MDEILGSGHIRDIMARDLQTGCRKEPACGTLVTALVLLPDRTLAPDGTVPDWLHLCGNCGYIHDMVNRVAAEAASLGAALGEEENFEGYIQA